jgi:hypothetical protein
MEEWKGKNSCDVQTDGMRKKLDGGRREVLLLWSKGRC